jgi:uncharacterized protein (DUF2147 family)
MWNRVIACSGAAAFFAFSSPAYAADPSGMWITEGGKARVRIARCGENFCATIVSLREPNDPATGKPKLDKFNKNESQRTRPVVGIALMTGMKPNAPDQWQGSLYNPEDGNTYTGKMRSDGGSTLKLQGCVLGGLICKSETWTRAQ